MLTKLEKDNLEMLILAFLSKEPSYGYKIINDLESVVKISESTLYPILRRLKSKGDLESYSVVVNGRIRKYFRITKQGEKRVKLFREDIINISNIFSYIIKK